MSVEWNKQDAQSQGENLDRPGTQIAGSYLVIMVRLCKETTPP